jgi:hypothetical protein
MDEASLMMMMIGKTRNDWDKGRNKGSYTVIQYMYCKNWNHLKINQKITQQHTRKA